MTSTQSENSILPRQILPILKLVKCQEEKKLKEEIGCNLSSPWKRKWRHLLLYDTLCFFNYNAYDYFWWSNMSNNHKHLSRPLHQLKYPPPPPPVNYREDTHTAPQRQGIVSTIQLTRQHARVYTHKKSIYTHRYGNKRVWHPVYMCYTRSLLLCTYIIVQSLTAMKWISVFYHS